jgi:L-lactate dehydrogenase complex protein LldG
VVAGPVSAREEVLARIAAALGPGPAPPPEVPRGYRGAGQDGTGAAAGRPGGAGRRGRGEAAGGEPAAAIDLFCERVADYRATVARVGSEDELAAALATACARRRTTTIAAAPGMRWRVAGVELTEDGAHIAPPDLDRFDAALTGCALAIAETGTIVLDGAPASGRRALTLVPDHHLCVVRAEQIVETVPQAIAALAPAAREGRPITFVSGPSATSDIELERVEGVHGPRKLDVFVLGVSAASS